MGGRCQARLQRRGLLSSSSYTTTPAAITSTTTVTVTNYFPAIAERLEVYSIPTGAGGGATITEGNGATRISLSGNAAGNANGVPCLFPNLGAIFTVSPGGTGASLIMLGWIDRANVT
jgi:hypothetical protein